MIYDLLNVYKFFARHLNYNIKYEKYKQILCKISYEIIISFIM